MSRDRVPAPPDARAGKCAGRRTVLGTHFGLIFHRPICVRGAEVDKHRAGAALTSKPLSALPGVDEGELFPVLKRAQSAALQRRIPSQSLVAR